MSENFEEGRQYFTVLTEQGEIEYTNAQLQDRGVDYSYLVLGDGNGNIVEPDRTALQLRHEIHAAPITAIYVKPENPNWLYIEAVIPASIGGFWVREIGVKSSNGTLMAHGNYPASYKPTLSNNGLARDLQITMVIETTSAAPPILVLSPSELYVTHAAMLAAFNLHRQGRDQHPYATTSLLGFARYATVVEAGIPDTTQEDAAVTPAGLQAALRAIVSAMPSDSMPAHLLALDPHSQYFNSTKLNARDKKSRTIRSYHANF